MLVGKEVGDTGNHRDTILEKFNGFPMVVSLMGKKFVLPSLLILNFQVVKQKIHAQGSLNKCSIALLCWNCSMALALRVDGVQPVFLCGTKLGHWIQ